MKILTVIKVVLQVVSVCIFFYQTTMALIKYFESPTIVINTETILHENLDLFPR